MMEVGNNVQLVYRPSIDYRDVFLTYWKKDSKPYVFLLPIPDSSRAVGKPKQPPRSPLVSDAKIQNAAEKRSKPGLNVEWNRGSAFYSPLPCNGGTSRGGVSTHYFPDNIYTCLR